jgi:hypothetical protein
MPFAYYDRLSSRDQAIYRASDRVVEILLARPEDLRPLVEPIRAALAGDDRAALEAAASHLCRALTAMVGVPPADVGVLAVRPTLRDTELHGLYTRDDKRPPRIRVWMRTVRYRRVVAFRTFLRTLLHELGHHLDYEHLRLPDSFHTEGFFKRESSLFYQLVPRDDASGSDDDATGSRRGGRSRTRKSAGTS